MCEFDEEQEKQQRECADYFTPKEVVHYYCRSCLGDQRWNYGKVKECEGNISLPSPCRFFPYRLGKRISIKVIRKFCLDCMCGSENGVRECTTESCECWDYRFGKRPYVSNREWTEEQKQAVAERFKKAREAKANEIIRSECMSAMDFCD